MKRQNYRQTKITESTPKETDVTSLPEKEFKIKIINMLMEMQRNIQEGRDEVWREITDAQKEITEVKQTLEGFMSRMDKMQRKMQEQWDEVRKEITDVRKEITEVKQSLEG